MQKVFLRTADFVIKHSPSVAAAHNNSRMKPPVDELPLKAMIQSLFECRSNGYMLLKSVELR